MCKVASGKFTACLCRILPGVPIKGSQFTGGSFIGIILQKLYTMSNYNRFYYEEYYTAPPESGVVAIDDRNMEDRNVANDYVWHGRSLETTEEVTDWLETLADEDLRQQFSRVTITKAFALSILKQFGRLDSELEVSPSTQLGIFVNTMRQQGALQNVTQTLLKNSAVELGVNNTDTYRLFYHAGIEMKACDPDTTRGMHNFMSMIDNMNQPPDIENVITQLQVPINLEDIRPLQAVAVLTGELANQEVTLKADAALRNALAGTYNLLRFIHEQRPHEDASSNAGKIMQSLRAHHAQDVYANLRDRTMQVPHIPYTEYIKLANRFSGAIAKMEKGAGEAGELKWLDEVSIIDLPKALDRILFIACLGEVSAVIAEKPEIQDAIATTRLAVDNVIGYGVERKMGTAPLTLQEVVVALRTYLPPAEAEAAIQRIADSQEEAPPNRDALQRRVKLGRQVWVEERQKRPGYGKLS